MSQIHFFTTRLILSNAEMVELAIQIEQSLIAKGRANDRVIVMSELTYQTSMPIEEPF